MAYYHVTNKKIIEAIDDVLRQEKVQRKAFRSVLKEMGCEAGYVTLRGMIGVKVEDTSKFDKKIWCSMGVSKYGSKSLKPRRKVKAAKEIRDLFATVPEVSLVAYLKSLKISFPIIDDMTGKALFFPGYVKLKEGSRYILHVGEWANKLVTFPRGVKEITHEQYVKWGGK